MSDFCTDTIWVVMPDYGLEGLREPVAAFKSEEQAKAWMKSVECLPAYQRMKLASAPIYYFAPTTLQR